MPIRTPISIGILLSPLFFLSNVKSFPIIINPNAVHINILLDAELKGTSVTIAIAAGIKKINKATK